MYFNNQRIPVTLGLVNIVKFEKESFNVDR